MEKLQELFTDRVNNTLWANKKHYYDKFEVEQNLNRLDMLKQFIKWLVDNDKIDFKKVIKNNYWNMSCISNWIYDYDTISNELKTKYLLMILSIQYIPIEFLISVLQ